MTQQIADRVRRYREALGLDEREATARAAMSQSIWERVENGESEPTLGQLAAIAQALGRTFESLTETTPVRDRLLQTPHYKRDDLRVCSDGSWSSGCASGPAVAGPGLADGRRRQRRRRL